MTDDRRLPERETGRPGIPNYFCVTAYLLKGGVTQVGELYEVVATLEVAKGGDKVEGSAIRRMFARHFPKWSWTVPETIEGWEEHIEAHPPDSPTDT